MVHHRGRRGRRRARRSEGKGFPDPDPNPPFLCDLCASLGSLWFIPRDASRSHKAWILWGKQTVRCSRAPLSFAVIGAVIRSTFQKVVLEPRAFDAYFPVNS